MKIGTMIKEKTVGYGFTFVSTLLALAASIAYLIFGMSSHTFVPWILICTLGGFLISGVLFFYNGYFSDFFPLLTTALVTVAFLLLANDSIDDITAWVVGMGSYFGNADNVGPRVVVAVFMLLCVISSIVGSFMKQKKN